VLSTHLGDVQRLMKPTKLALIIEDEKPLLIMYSRSVEIAGYDTMTASNGREALNILETYTPDMIFLDMLLPYIGGEEILRYLANEPRFATTHVIIMSSNIEFRMHQTIMPNSEFHLKPLLPSHIKTITTRIDKPLAS